MFFNKNMDIKILKKRLDKADEIALHHGFRFEEIPTAYTNKNTPLHPEEKHHVLKTYGKMSGKGANSQPLMLYFDRPILINKKQIPNLKTHKILSLDIIGVQNSIAEAMLINTASKILSEEGYKNFFIDINCTGDKDSLNKFIEEVGNYYKKHSGSFNCSCKYKIDKKNFLATSCENENCRELIENAPRPINYLTEKSRQHFKEVLEYLEDMRLPYRINSDLVVEDNHYSKTVFEIKTLGEDSTELILARGGRYDDVANKIIGKRNLPAVGLSMIYKKNGFTPAYSNKINTPQIFLIQFGFKAKLKSFEVIDILRRQKITVHQKLYKNKLSDQFISAKKTRVPYMIIIGQKEALEDEVIFKNTFNVSYEIVKISKLPQYLKKIKFV